MIPCLIEKPLAMKAMLGYILPCVALHAIWNSHFTSIAFPKANCNSAAQRPTAWS
jgi:hypothetical protein